MPEIYADWSRQQCTENIFACRWCRRDYHKRLYLEALILEINDYPVSAGRGRKQWVGGSKRNETTRGLSWWMTSLAWSLNLFKWILKLVKEIPSRPWPHSPTHPRSRSSELQSKIQSRALKFIKWLLKLCFVLSPVDGGEEEEADPLIERSQASSSRINSEIDEWDFLPSAA